MSLGKRGRPRKTTKAQIVHNALSIYWQEGLLARSLNDICRKLEVSKPGIYREFGGEDGLLAECLILYAEGINQQFDKIMAKDLPFQMQLGKFIDSIFKLHASYPQGCLLMQARRHQKLLGRQSLEVLYTKEASVYQKTLSWVQHAADQGKIPPDVSIEAATRLILAQIGEVHSGLSAGLPISLVRGVTDLSLHALSEPV